MIPPMNTTHFSVQGIKRFVAKIGFGNQASQTLFTQLGYREKTRSEVFQEITFECQLEDAAEQLSAVRSTVRYQAITIGGRSDREPCVHPAEGYSQKLRSY